MAELFVDELAEKCVGKRNTNQVSMIKAAIPCNNFLLLRINEDD